MSTKQIQNDKPKDPATMKQLEEFTRRVLAVPKGEVDSIAGKRRQKKKRVN